MEDISNANVTPETNSTNNMENTEQTIAPETPVKKKKRFSLKIKLLIFFLSIPVIFLSMLVVIFLIQKALNARVGFDKTDNPPIIEPVKVQPETTFLDASVDKFTLEYPLNSIFTPPSSFDETRTYTITYKGARQAEDITGEENLADGYIMKIVVHKDTINQNVRDITQRKRDSYQQICTAGFSPKDIKSTKIDTIDARNFIILNCPYDLKESFALLHGNLYEIVQIQRGDLGYIEKYKQETEKILSSFLFIDKPLAPELPTTKTYYNSKHAFSFEHPLMDETCCKINGPVFGNPEKQVILGDKETYDQSKGKSFDGFGVFIDLNKEHRTFEEYMEIQKATLQDEYKVITGKRPSNPQESEVEVGNVKAVMLKNYAWWGDMVYFQYPANDKFVIISKVDASKGSFDETFEVILESFKFNLKR